ncbi:MAG: hypothetical protein RLY93_19085 [Sumerlaeia bacterium]
MTVSLAVSSFRRRLPTFLVLSITLLLAWLQLGPLVHKQPEDGGPWFLYGRDTVSHDAVVQIWAWGEVVESGGTLPLWIPELQAGLPTLGSWLWTPFHPTLWLHAVLPFALAQRAQFTLALWVAMLGGYWLGRGMGLRRGSALLLGVGFGLSGHLVTLIHAGHLQKVLALAWLPWVAGGAERAFARGASWREAARGAAVAALAWGLMFLSGHPQIAYIGLMLVVARAAALLRHDWRRAVAGAAFIGAIGGCVGAVQLLPGLEMAPLSNRAEGVSYDEAVETSYPSLELLEFALPRFLGDSSAAGHGVYAGRWGERLVSDYPGVAVVLLATLAFAARSRRRMAGFWTAVLLASLLVGMGRYTPLYRLLYEAWPGMKSFRSPGTFFAAAALAWPVLAALGIEAWRDRIAAAPEGKGKLLIAAVAALCAFGFALLLVPLARRMADDGVPAALFAVEAAARTLALAAAVLGGLMLLRTQAGTARERWIAAGLVVLLAADLAWANRAFLIAEDWRRYDAYLAPRPLDNWAAANLDEPRRVLELGREQSLTPILHDRDALLGYHPVSFRTFSDTLDVEGGYLSPEWRAAWGVRHIATTQLPEPMPAGWRIVARFQDGVHVLEDQGTPLSDRTLVGDQIARRPGSYRVGLFLTVVGVGVVALILLGTYRPRVNGISRDERTEASLP